MLQNRVTFRAFHDVSITVIPVGAFVAFCSGLTLFGANIAAVIAVLVASPFDTWSVFVRSRVRPLGLKKVLREIPGHGPEHPPWPSTSESREITF